MPYSRIMAYKQQTMLYTVSFSRRLKSFVLSDDENETNVDFGEFYFLDVYNFTCLDIDDSIVNSMQQEIYLNCFDKNFFCVCRRDCSINGLTTKQFWQHGRKIDFSIWRITFNTLFTVFHRFVNVLSLFANRV